MSPLRLHPSKSPTNTFQAFSSLFPSHFFAPCLIVLIEGFLVPSLSSPLDASSNGSNQPSQAAKSLVHVVKEKEAGAPHPHDGRLVVI